MDVMVTVALARVLLSASVTVIPLSTATGVEVTLLPSVNWVALAEVVTTGAALAESLAPFMVTVRVDVAVLFDVSVI